MQTNKDNAQPDHSMCGNGLPTHRSSKASAMGLDANNAVRAVSRGAAPRPRRSRRGRPAPRIPSRTPLGPAGKADAPDPPQGGRRRSGWACGGTGTLLSLGRWRPRGKAWAGCWSLAGGPPNIVTGGNDQITHPKLRQTQDSHTAAFKSLQKTGNCTNTPKPRRYGVFQHGFEED